MRSYIEKERVRYNRAVGVAEFIIEGNTIKKTREEFNISRETIERNLEFLVHCLLGDRNRNIKLYIDAKKQLKKNIGCQKKEQ